MCKSAKWSEVSVIVRRELEEWGAEKLEGRNKLKVIKVQSLDEI
jgi:hypothetical protein